MNKTNEQLREQVKRLATEGNYLLQELSNANVKMVKQRMQIDELLTSLDTLIEPPVVSDSVKYEISFALNTHYTKLDEYDKAISVVANYFDNFSLVQQVGSYDGKLEVSYLLVLIRTDSTELETINKFANYLMDNYNQMCILVSKNYVEVMSLP